MGLVRVLEESSASRTGKHKRRALFKVIDIRCKPLKYEIVSKRKIKPLYSRGSAYIKEIRVPDNALVVALELCLNLRKHVKGVVRVYGSDGSVLAEAVYRKLKVRFKFASSETLIDVVRCVFRSLKLPVKKYALLRGIRG